MPKAIPQSELEAIYGIVDRLRAGASLEDIRRELNIKVITTNLTTPSGTIGRTGTIGTSCNP